MTKTFVSFGDVATDTSQIVKIVTERAAQVASGIEVYNRRIHRTSQRQFHSCLDGPENTVNGPAQKKYENCAGVDLV